jgi:hypothetical protein
MVDYHTREKISHSGKRILRETKGSMFFIILNASSKEDFEFLLKSVSQWDTLCTYHYLNKATTTIISTSNIFINNNRKQNVNNKYIDK